LPQIAKIRTNQPLKYCCGAAAQREVFSARLRQNDRARDCIVQKSGEVMRRKQTSHTAKMRSKLSFLTIQAAFSQYV
jgi:hypothetical protein